MEVVSLIHWAVFSNKEEVLKECIESGYDINEENILFQTPLMEAVKKNNFNLVKILVENNADLNIIDIYGTTALGYAQENDQIENYLKSKNAQCLIMSNSIKSELEIEIENGEEPSITTKEVINSVDKRGMTPFMWAIWYQSLKHFVYYLELGANVNQVGRNGITPLLIASILSNNDAIIQDLKNKGACLNQLNNCKKSTLKIPLNVSLLKYLATKFLDKKEQIDTIDKRELNVLITKTLINYIFQLNLLSTNKNEKVNRCSKEGNTALVYAAISGNIECAKILLAKGADINLCGLKGKTPLTWAVIANQFEMVKFLMQNGANSNCIDYNQNIAFFYAKKYNFSEIIKYFLEIAIFEFDFKIITMFLNDDTDSCKENDKTSPVAEIEIKDIPKIEYIFLNGVAVTIRTALPIAIKQNDEKIVKLLLERKAQPNIIYKMFNQTPLLQAVEQQNFEIVKILLEYRSNPNTSEKLSPLRRAIQLENFKIVQILIENGANVNEVVRQDQESLLRTAISGKNLEIITYLIENGADIYHDIAVLNKLAEENENFANFLKNYKDIDFGLASFIESNREQDQELKATNNIQQSRKRAKKFKLKTE